MRQYFEAKKLNLLQIQVSFMLPSQDNCVMTFLAEKVGISQDIYSVEFISLIDKELNLSKAKLSMLSRHALNIFILNIPFGIFGLFDQSKISKVIGKGKLILESSLKCFSLHIINCRRSC